MKKQSFKSKYSERTAFTLAEVLITLGIIGVVAAMTLPTLVQHYRKQVVETRLAKFYSVMNQAIQQSEVDNGPKEYWEPLSAPVTDESGNQITTTMQWYDKYLKKYLKVADAKFNNKNAGVMIYFPDGSMANMNHASIHFWPEAKNFVDFQITDTGSIKNNMELSGVKYFTFMLCPWQKSNKYAYRKGVEPYRHGDNDNLLNNGVIGCKEHVTDERAFCTALIQMNGWKIPNDYPLKF